jgi:nitroreductase
LRDFVADREDEAAAPDDDADPPVVERPLVAVLGTREDDVVSLLAAGQAVGRVLLLATARGVAASPMTQPLEIPDTRRRLARELGLVGHPQMILRLGYADVDAGRPTPRRQVDDILSQE